MRRVVTAIALFALAVYLIFFAADWGFKVAAVCMSLLCYWEYSGLVAAHAFPRLPDFTRTELRRQSSNIKIGIGALGDLRELVVQSPMTPRF